MKSTAKAIRSGAAAAGDHDPQLTRYMAEVGRHPLLSREQEQQLALAYRRDNDIDAAHCLVTSHLRFVVKVAHEYGRYGLRLLDLIQEGNMGLMVAVKRFDPERGYRLITYAVWWIRAHIQSFIMRSWSLVRMGATSAHRRLFFRLSALRAEAARAGRHGAAADDDIAQAMQISTATVAAMGQRLAARDFSLDTAADDGGTSPIHRLTDPGACPEARLSDAQDSARATQAVQGALGRLSDKERSIVQARLLDDEPKTLASIGKSLGVSRERVRQIEQRARLKLRAALQPHLAALA